MKSDPEPGTPTQSPVRQFHLRDRASSFRYAAAGLARMVRTQHNARIHLAATILVVIAGGLCGLKSADWLWLSTAITLVWITEAFNTAIELLGDAVTTEINPLIGHAKDASAAAVLIAAVSSVVIGLFVFVPYLSS